MVLKNNSGITIIEAMIAAAIASIVLLGVCSLYINQQSFSITQDRKSKLQRNLRSAVDIMQQDIRMAGYKGDPAGSVIFGISSQSTASEIRYTIDEDEDGVIDDGEEHRFRLDSNILKYTKNANVGQTTGSVSDWHSLRAGSDSANFQFTSLQFIYSDEDGDSEYDKVVISLTGRFNLPLRTTTYEYQTLTGEIILRNKYE